MEVAAMLYVIPHCMSNSNSCYFLFDLILYRNIPTFLKRSTSFILLIMINLIFSPFLWMHFLKLVKIRCLCSICKRKTGLLYSHGSVCYIYEIEISLNYTYMRIKKMKCVWPLIYSLYCFSILELSWLLGNLMQARSFTCPDSWSNIFYCRQAQAS